MKTPFTVPYCMIAGAKLLFPTLDFGRIDFFLDDIDGPTGPGGTTNGGLFRTQIALLRGNWTAPDASCSEVNFRVLCHELVHALQIQSCGALLHNAASFACDMLHGNGAEQADPGAKNCVETEAYRYEYVLLPSLTIATPPCLCVSTGNPFLDASVLPIANPAFPAAVAARPDLIKTEAGCLPWDCIETGIVETVIGWSVVIGALAGSFAAPFWYEGLAAKIGTIAGAVGGVIVGSVVGSWIGGLIGTVLGILIGAFLGALAGGFAGAVVDWIAGLFGDDGGALNLMFSTDGGMTFVNKVSFERSEQPMSLAFGPTSLTSDRDGQDRLCIAWTGTDDRVNLLTVPQNTKLAFARSSDCGPAVATMGVRMHVGWQGNDQSLCGVMSWDGIKTANQFVLGAERSLEEASPALTVGFDSNLDIFMSWVGGRNLINIVTSPNGVDWGHKITLREASAGAGTAALAWADDRLVVAWTATNQAVNILQMERLPDGSLKPGYKTTLREYSAKDAGPALAYGGGVLFLAWIGTNGAVNVMRSRDKGANFESKVSFEKSRDDCGPALAYHEASGTLCVGWTGTK